MVNSPKRFTVLCAPTGWGKTSAYVGAALLSGLPTAIVTESRALQDQLMDDYSEIGMVDLRGRRNYACDMKEGYTCEEGHAARCPYKGSVACPSSQAEIRASTSNLVVMNYDKWTAAKKYGQGLQHFQQLICDEGHSAPGAVARAMQVLLNHKEIEERLRFPFLSGSDAADVANWKLWATHGRPLVVAAMNAAQAKILGVSDPKPAWVRDFTHMRHLARRFAIISTCRPLDWIVEQVEGGFQFDPIRPGRYAESALFMKIPRVIITSATIRPKTPYMLGIKKDDFEFLEFDSDFDPSRCPIYYVPTMRVDDNAPNLTPIWAMLDRIAARRRDRNGIVHTISYTRQQLAYESSRFAQSMILNKKGEAPTRKIEEFKSTYPGAIFVTPSVGTGHDFPMRQCEWQLVCKIPFEPPSRIVKAREADDKDYRGYQAMQGLVQMFGRAMRSKTDRAENFILDRHLDWFLPRFRHLAPKSFHGFFKEIRYLPSPPERLAA